MNKSANRVLDEYIYNDKNIPKTTDKVYGKGNGNKIWNIAETDNEEKVQKVILLEKIKPQMETVERKLRAKMTRG